MMLKLGPVFRAFVMAATILLLASTASASTYTMEDYYNALAAVENDNQNISNLESDIQSLDQQIQWANDYYQWQVEHGCHLLPNSSNEMAWYAYMECQDGWRSEWSSVVSGLEAIKAADEVALWFAQAQLATDQGTLALIMADLGLS